MRSLVFNILKYLIRRKFPSVQRLSTQELAQWLENHHKPQPFLLDARSETEYAVSHLQHAERIEPYNPNLEALQKLQKDRPIVVYCSVGYRSARIAELLEQAGFSHVYNLEGSIFQWANEGKPVFKDEQPTMLVHHYNSRWGRLLKASLRSEM